MTARPPVTFAQQGHDVIVLIDDGYGRKLAASEQHRLVRLTEENRAIGSLRLISTVTVLERAAGGEFLQTRAELRELYERLRTLDVNRPRCRAVLF